MVNYYMTAEVVLPDGLDYLNPIVSNRPELPTHDFYSLFAGMCIMFLSITAAFYLLSVSVWSWDKLRRRNAIRYGDGNRRPRSNSLTVLQQFQIYWQRKGRHYIGTFFRFLYLLFWIGLVLPLMVGLLFNFYILTPVQGAFGKYPLVFVILDWSTGAMTLRIAYQIQMMRPAHRISQLINQNIALGLFRMNLSALTTEIFMPIFGACYFALSAPFLARVLEKIGSKALDIDLDFALDVSLASVVLKYGAVAAAGVYIGFNLIRNSLASFENWFDHLKDDQFLVGRTLQNAS
jgi:hypothetical protein